jgi:N-methylhydantoinase A/oxoprolinase/acetone carboxylase beta subunit
VVDRGTLGPGSVLTGPAIVEQVDSTIVIHPRQKASVDEFGNLLIAV